MLLLIAHHAYAGPHLDTLPLRTHFWSLFCYRRHHQIAEQAVCQQVSSLAEGSVLDDGSRMIVVSWMVEVAEEYGLQQETLHAAVHLLDRFLSTSNVSQL